jgi:peptide/nickel transport system ATP-binding protein
MAANTPRLNACLRFTAGEQDCSIHGMAATGNCRLETHFVIRDGEPLFEDERQGNKYDLELFISEKMQSALVLGALLEVHELVKYFMVKKGFRQMFQKGQQFVKAVDGVSFSLERGKVLVLAGESGSGKTTVARLVLRAENPDGGSIIFDGEDITRHTGRKLKKFRTSVHMVYQDPYASLNPRMKIRDIVMEPLSIHDRASSRQQKEEKVMKSLEEVRLPAAEIALRLPHMLSGGQRQRVALARALVMRPALIVADEPVSMLDVSVRGEILGLMHELRQKFNIAYMYITHDLSTARYVGDNLAVMNAGKIVEIGPIDRVLSSPVHPYTQELIAAIPDPDRVRS